MITNLYEVAYAIEVRVKLTQPIDEKDQIQFLPFTKEVEPVLFHEIAEAVQSSLNRQYAQLDNDIAKICKESKGIWEGMK